MITETTKFEVQYRWWHGNKLRVIRRQNVKHNIGCISVEFWLFFMQKSSILHMLTLKQIFKNALFGYISSLLHSIIFIDLAEDFTSTVI